VEAAGSPSLSRISATTPSPTPSSAGRPRERCVKIDCRDKREKLREVIKERDTLKQTLIDERKTAYTNYVEGMGRAHFDAMMGRVRAEHDADVKDLKKHNASYLKKSKKLGEERKVLLDELAEVMGLYTISEQTIAATARREALDMRARGREERQLEAAAADVKHQMETARVRSELEIEEAGRQASVAEERAIAAECQAATARRDADAEREAARLAMEDADLSNYQTKLLQRQIDRAKSKADKIELQLQQLAPTIQHLSANRSADEWQALHADAKRKAEQRERDTLRRTLSATAWRPACLADVLDELGILTQLFNTRQGWRIYFGKVKVLHTKLEKDDFGIRFGLFLHIELRIPLAKIQLCVEAACKEYHRNLNRFSKKPWLSNPYNKSMILYTPRIVPARTKLEPVIKELAATLGVQSTENGLLAFRSIDVILQEIVARDMGKLKMPTLPEFYGGLKLPIIISRDATGKGRRAPCSSPLALSVCPGPPSPARPCTSYASASAVMIALARGVCLAPTCPPSTPWSPPPQRVRPRRSRWKGSSEKSWWIPTSPTTCLLSAMESILPTQDGAAARAMRRCGRSPPSPPPYPRCARSSAARGRRHAAGS
jgi:hypothetical protein